MLHYNKFIGVPWNAYQNKNMPLPLLGAAAILGGSSIISGISSALGSGYSSRKAVAAQEAANATNLQIARETNQANRDLWHEQTEYNTPLNQMKRFRDAGINPYMAMSQISPGLAESAPQMQAASVDSTYNSVAAAADMQKISQIGNLIPNALNAAMGAEQLQSMDYQNQILKSQAQYSQGMVFQQYMNMVNQNNLLDKQNKYQAMQNFYLPTLNDMTLQQGEQFLKESNERITTMQVQRDVMEVSKRYNIALTNQVNQDIANSVKQLSWNIKVARSQIASNYASSEQALAAADVNRQTKKLVAQQEKLFRANTLKTLREANLIPHGKNANSYVNALIDKAWQDAETSRQNAFGSKLRNRYESDWQQSLWYPVGNAIQHLSPLGAFLK